MNSEVGLRTVIKALLNRRSTAAFITNRVMYGTKHGDWRSLAIYLEEGGVITKEMREFLAEVLRGDSKRPNNRAPSLIAELTSMSRAFLVLTREREVGREPAIDEAADKFQVNRRTIQRDLQELERRLKEEEPVGKAAFAAGVYAALNSASAEPQSER
jgi:hypothetical protein